jgi:hypothetical protein
LAAGWCEYVSVRGTPVRSNSSYSFDGSPVSESR